MDDECELGGLGRLELDANRSPSCPHCVTHMLRASSSDGDEGDHTGCLPGCYTPPRRPPARQSLASRVLFQQTATETPCVC